MLFLLFSLHRLSFVSVVLDFNASANDVAPVSPMKFPVDLMGMENGGLLMDAFSCVVSFSCSPLRLSSTSVVFDFNASLNDVAPVFPMQFTVDLIMEKSGLLMDVICAMFLLSSPLRLSSVSVVFDFNASLNDVAPLSPILLSVELMRVERVD